MTKARAILVCVFIFVLSLLRTIWLALLPTSFRRRKSIRGSVALVTGGGNGLGRELCLRLSQLGATVVVLDVDRVGLDETCVRVRSRGGKVKGYTCDVGRREDIYSVANRVKEEVGEVGILVNNAGVANGNMFLDTSDEGIEKVYAINTLAHYWTCKAFLPDMIKANRGHVVAVASVAGMTGFLKATEYVGSKHAVVGFMETLQLELLHLGASGVVTTTVCPYFIDTGMFTCKYDGIIPMLETGDVVEKIIEGMLLNKEKVVIPRNFYLANPLKNMTSSSAMLNFQFLMGGRKLIETLKLTRSPTD